MPASDPTKIIRAKKELVNLLGKEPGFVGAGIASAEAGNVEIVVFVTEANSSVINKIPKTWKGFSVRIEISGRPRKFNKP